MRKQLDDRKLRELWNRFPPYTLKEIAQLLGGKIGTRWLSGYAAGLKLPCRPKMYLPRKTVVEVIRLLREGEKKSQIIRTTGVSRSTVFRIAVRIGCARIYNGDPKFRERYITSRNS